MNINKEFDSQNVKDLLLDFYSKNFEKAHVSIELAVHIVEIAWDKEIDVEQKIRQLNRIYKKANTIADRTRVELDLLDLIVLKENSNFLDIGANKLDLVNKLASKHKSVTFTACDIIPQANEFRFPDRSTYLQINSNQQIPILDNSFDVINIKFVLHHLESDSEINFMLSEVNRLLKKDGRLYIWEESFRENIEDIDKTIEINYSLGILTDYELTQKFQSLSKKEKYQFILVNDWIINAYNKHMPWTNMYKSWEKWIEIFSDKGFYNSKEYNLGLRLNGKVKQGINMLGEFIRHSR